jgi:hypothetical protein
LVDPQRHRPAPGQQRGPAGDDGLGHLADGLRVPQRVRYRRCQAGAAGRDNVAKDLGVFNIAGALPFTIAPAITPAILAIDGGSYDVLYTVAGFCAVLGRSPSCPRKGSGEHRQRGDPSAQWAARYR